MTASFHRNNEIVTQQQKLEAGDRKFTGNRSLQLTLKNDHRFHCRGLFKQMFKATSSYTDFLKCFILNSSFPHSQASHWQCVCVCAILQMLPLLTREEKWFPTFLETFLVLVRTEISPCQHPKQWPGSVQLFWRLHHLCALCLPAFVLCWCASMLRCSILPCCCCGYRAYLLIGFASCIQHTFVQHLSYPKPILQHHSDVDVTWVKG